MLLALSSFSAVFFLTQLTHQGMNGDFLNYFMMQVIYTSWMALSIFAYGAKLGIVSSFSDGMTSRIVWSAVAVASFAFGKLLFVEFASGIFPVTSNALTQTFYIGVFMKTLALLGLGVTIFAAASQYLLIVPLASDAMGRKTWLTCCLVICHAAIIISLHFLATSLEELSRGNTGNLALIYIAGSLDFTETHLCSAAPGERILFIDGYPDRALAARFPSLPLGPLHYMGSEVIKEALPKGFRMVSCNTIESAIISK
ncbi:hypothetical protein [Cupriavidus basilensis]|uniref:Uncharacterized protein n=1 Tax=Cupriavidus basilensis TaxID=68895 RepID=A0A643FY25_9BURK|nr:hypothetical protein [Cupriavidus basilensis]QOT76564.1 hypothetical protein F7R26_000130 [Cupriavidus basilensis]